MTIMYLVCKYFAVTSIRNMSIFSPIAFLLVYNSMWVSPLLSPFCALSSEDENLNASGIVLPALKSAERCLSHCFRKCSQSNTVSFQTVSAASQIFEDQECSLYLASCNTSMAEGKEGTINSVLWFTDISGITMRYMLTFFSSLLLHYQIELLSFNVLLQMNRCQELFRKFGKSLCLCG